MPTLLIQHRGSGQTRVELSTQPITLGRADTCDVVLREDGEVSREHAHVWIDENGCVVVADKNSKNGTRVDGGDLFRDSARVAHRSIRLGEHEITIVGAPPRQPTSKTTVMFTPDAPGRAGDTHFFPSSKRLDLNQQRLALLMGLTDRIGGTFDSKQLLEQALDACCEALGFERGLIALKTPRGEPELPVTRNIQRDETGAFKVSRTLINRALIEGQRAIVNNPATDLVGNLSESLVRFPICSALCVPILNRDDILGVIYGDRITQRSTYTAADVDFLAAIAQQLGVGLANLRLFQEHLRTQKVYAELERARDIQRDLLPSKPLKVGRMSMDGYNEPSSAVGGDYFDYYELEDDRVGFIIADVTGHGLAAALVMANLQAAAHVALRGKSTLPELARHVNRLICRNTPSHVFITAILGFANSSTGQLDYVNAGHPGPILLHGGEVTATEEVNSLPLGIDPDEDYVVRHLNIGHADDAVLFYTDGLTEAADAEERILDLPPVVEMIGTLPESNAPALLGATLALVRKHRGDVPNADDLTLLAMHYSA